MLLTVLVIAAFLFVWFQWKLIFLAFAGLLLGILLDTIRGWIRSRTPLGRGAAYFVTLGLIFVFFVGLGVWIVPRMVTQLSEVVKDVPQALAHLENSLAKKDWGQDLLNTINRAAQHTNVSAKVTNGAAAVMHAVVDIIVVVVIGFFGALTPRSYREGVFILFPDGMRPKAREVVSQLVERLRWWLFGQMVPMVVLGVASAIALYALGVHLAFSLGLLTGFMVFVPYAGTILAGIPCVLLGLQKSPMTAVWVLCLYTLFHLCEGYLLTPMVQRRAVSLPPVVTVLAQFFLWSFAGILGVAIAAPLAAAAMVLTNELYVKPRDSRELQQAAAAQLPDAS